MYCPNCGKENSADQSYCRGCGLKLGEIALAVAEVLPSKENLTLKRRKRLLEKLGKGSLLISGLIAMMSFIFAAALYKLILFGPEVLFLASAIALAVFVMVGVGLIGYSKLFLPSVSIEERALETDATFPNSAANLIGDRPFEPVPSVVGNTTDLLPQRSPPERN